MRQLGTSQQYALAPWMRVAEKYIGVKEIRGGENPVILKFFADAGHSEILNDETAWCSAYLNAIMIEAGYSGTKNLMAKSWLRWDDGLKVTEPRFGDIVILTNGNPKSPHGHVAFFLDWDEDTVTILGGNQGKLGEVSVTMMSRSRLVGFRRPKSIQPGRMLPKPTRAAIPEMSMTEKPNTSPEKTGVIGALSAGLAVVMGNYEIALVVAAMAVLTFFVVWYVKQKRALSDVVAMRPQYAPSSHVAASKKIADFVSPTDIPKVERKTDTKKKTTTKKVKNAK